MSHIPTTDQIIDSLIVRIESDEPDQAELQTLEAALALLEGYMARRDRIEVLAMLAEMLIDERSGVPGCTLEEAGR